MGFSTPKLTASRLREVVTYSPETGEFVWVVRQNNRMKIGDKAGSGNGLGYLQIRVDGVKYKSHRLAWLYMTGEWPKFEIDHINRVKDDNRWENLRASDRSSNLQNQTDAMSNNRTGLLGVTKIRGRYIARIKASGNSIFLGGYDSAEAAHDAYLKAKTIYHPASQVAASC